MTRHTRLAAVAALATAAALALTACGGGDPLETEDTGDGGSASSESITVGSADFSESVLLAEIYAGALRSAGVDATTNTNIGSREIYLKALEDGSIDLIPEYTGALSLYYDPEFSETDPDAVYSALQGLLPDNLKVLEKSQAEDNDSIVVTRDTADTEGLTTIADLSGVAGDLTLGAPPEFKERAQGIPGLKETYGVEFGTFRPLKGQALVQALKNGQVDAANIFSTDPAIPENDFVTLQDTEKLFGSQNVVPLIAADKSTSTVDAALNKVSAALTTDLLSGLLARVDVDKEDPSDVADSFLSDIGMG